MASIASSSHLLRRTARNQLPLWVALLTITVLSPLALQAAAQAVVVGPVFDAGAVAQGETIEHAFELRNEGDTPLTLVEVRPGCGCTVAEFDSEIAPGARGQVRIQLDTGEFKGPIAKGVRVFTSDAANPELQLVVKANVQVFIEAQPGYTRFVYVAGEASPSARHILFSPTGESFKVTGIRSPYPFVEATYREASAEERDSAGKGRQWVIDLEADSEAPIGPLADYVEVRTDSRRQPVVQIPIAGYVQPIIAVTPAEADFGERRLTESYRSTFEVRNFSERDIDVTAVESDIPGLTAEIHSLKNRRFEVRVTLAPSMAKGQFAGSLRLRTNSVQQPLIEVPVRGKIL